jgi:hypothetical protein
MEATLALPFRNAPGVAFLTMVGGGRTDPVTDATRFGLFRRLRRATSRAPLAPSLTSTATEAGLDPGPAYPFPPEGLAVFGAPWRPATRYQGRVIVEEIVEPVWVLEPEG